MIRERLNKFAQNCWKVGQRKDSRPSFNVVAEVVKWNYKFQTVSLSLSLCSLKTVMLVKFSSLSAVRTFFNVIRIFVTAEKLQR